MTFELRVPAPPYAAILLCDRIILNRDAILHCTILKPYIHWKAMLLSRHHWRSQDHNLSVHIWFWYATTKNNWSFQTILTMVALNWPIQYLGHPETLGKCIVVVPYCSSMGVTNLKVGKTIEFRRKRLVYSTLTTV